MPLVNLRGAGLFIPGDPRREPVLRHISWQIPQFSHWLLQGANGAGKSTLLRLLHGDLWATSGSIEWLVNDNYETSPIAAKSVSTLVSPLLQENCQRMAWPVKVSDILAGSWQNSPLSHFAQKTDGAFEEATEGILRKLNSLSLLDMPMTALSQGQLRLVLLARAILPRPRLLLLDEVADGLDEERRKLVFDLLEELAPAMAIVFASHRREKLPGWVNKSRWLRNGELFFSPPEKAGDNPGQTTERYSHIFTDDTLTKTENPAPAIPEPVQPLVEIANANVYVDRTLVLQDINWKIGRGENWRVSGANGSGKSTLLRLLAGDEQAASGGHIGRFSPRLNSLTTSLEQIRADFHLVSDLMQATYGYPLAGLELVCSGFDNSVGLYRQIRPDEKAEAMRLMEIFFGHSHAQALARKSIRQMSSGQLRRLYLARSITNRPAMLLLDEPCAGLDAQSRRDYLAMLDQLAGGALPGYKPQLVFVSHYDDDQPACVNRHATMNSGRLFIE